MNPFPAFLHPSFGKIAIVVMTTVFPLLAADPKPTQVLQNMKRVADWQIANPSKLKIHDWTQAPFFMGLASLYQVSIMT